MSQSGGDNSVCFVQDSIVSRYSSPAANEAEIMNIFTTTGVDYVYFDNLKTEGDMIARSIINATYVQNTPSSNKTVLATVKIVDSTVLDRMA